MLSISRWIREHQETLILVCLTSIGWFIRIILAINTGGLVHADEIYQSLEIAHYMKYGYGHIPWEFRVPGRIYGDILPGLWTYNSPDPIRSYLYPLIFYFIFELCELGGIPYGLEGTLRVVRLFNATYSAMLIPIVFYVSKELFPAQEKPYIFSLFAAFLTVVWFQFPFWGIRTLTNSFVCVPIFLGIYLHLLASNNTFSLAKTFSLESIAGVLLGLACVLRMDSVVFFAPIFLLRHYSDRRMSFSYVSLAIGFVAIFILQGLTDLIYYGIFFISPINWVIFNIIEGKSARFGTLPIPYYVYLFTKNSFYLIFFALVLGTLIIKTYITLWHNQEKRKDPWFFTFLTLFIWFMFSLGIMSLVAHKEERFIYSLYPIIVILFAATMKLCLELLKATYKHLHTNILPKFNITRMAK
ncbi:MAG: hypothetical protein ACFFBD_26415, partial [Candidatus Hodarchaeota archaeon]